MKIGVIIFPDNDCGKNLLHAFNDVMQVPADALWYNDKHALNTFDLIFISGGMDWYRQYIKDNPQKRALIVDSLLKMKSVRTNIIGLGEGFRLLCCLGLLPGSLEKNQSGHFINRNVYVRIDNPNRILTRGLNHNSPLILPVASLYGQYIALDQELIKMRQKDQILYRYCDALGTLSEEINYTGSKDNIAGVCNEQGNILGILPNIDRAVDELCGNIAGRILLKILLKNIEK